MEVEDDRVFWRPNLVNKWCIWDDWIYHRDLWRGSLFSVLAQVPAACICLCPPFLLVLDGWRIWLLKKEFPFFLLVRRPQSGQWAVWYSLPDHSASLILSISLSLYTRTHRHTIAHTYIYIISPFSRSWRLLQYKVWYNEWTKTTLIYPELY